MKYSALLKSIYRFFFTGIVCVLPGACEMLDVDPVSVITNDSYWKTEADAEGGLAGMYVFLRSESVFNLYLLGEMRSDALESEGIVGDNYRRYRENDLDGNMGPDWKGLYATVNAANLILTQVPNIPFTDENRRNEVLAQAYTMRAFVYFVLARTWGGVPLRLEPLLDYDPALIQKPRSPEKVIFEQIKGDLEEALRLFPTDAFPVGRCFWSKAAAYALKADVYLWTAKRLNGGEEDLRTAVAACEEVQRIGDIELLSDFGDIFKYENKGNAEILMAINYKLFEASNNYFNKMYIALADFSADIEEETKKVLGTPGGLIELSPAKRVKEQFSEDDRRKAATYVEVYKIKNDERVYFASVCLKGRGTVSSNVRYFVDDVILYRYADVLLLKAEAMNALGLDPSAEINEIRERAYGENFPAHKFVSGSKAENDEAILQERLFELLFEGKRWWDLVRFGKAFELVPSLVGREDPRLLYFPIPNSVLSLEPLVEPNEGWPL